MTNMLLMFEQKQYSVEEEKVDENVNTRPVRDGSGVFDVDVPDEQTRSIKDIKTDQESAATNEIYKSDIKI